LLAAERVQYVLELLIFGVDEEVGLFERLLLWLLSFGFLKKELRF
jgi:hypothetical protein